MSRPGRWSDDSIPVPQDGTRSEMSGTAGDVVQARDVTGGVHFHRPEREPARRPRQLPGDVRGFVNRTAELARLDSWLPQDENELGVTALVVVAGTAGVGKTALAVRWAHHVQDKFPDGQLYLNFRGYDPGQTVSPEQALDGFLRALDIASSAIPADLEAKSALYRSLLAGRRILVVLDNAATVRQVRPFLPGTAESLVIVTSRNRLSGLVALDGGRRVTLEILAEDDAVRLITSITSDYRAGDDPAEVAELARLCARLPLALRIAAERAASRPWMPLDQLIQDLRNESGLWDALSADDGEESDAVRTVFAWSYRALPENAARMFRLLGLHPGPEFGVTAAAALAGTTVPEARHQLDVLAGAHLLEQTTPDRYQFHDLLRAYATAQAHHEESLDAQYKVLRRVLTWYLHSASSAITAMESAQQAVPLDPLTDSVAPLDFTSQQDAVHWCETEQDNLFAAARAASKAGMFRIAWQLVIVLQPYAVGHLFSGDLLTLAEMALDAAQRDGDTRGEAASLAALANVNSIHSRFGHAIDQLTSAVALFAELEDRTGTALALTSLGVVHMVSRQFAEALGPLHQAQTILHELGDSQRESYALFNIGEANLGLGRLADAAETVHRSLVLCREAGDRFSESVALMNLARIHAERGETAEATGFAQEALDLGRAQQEPRHEGWLLLELGQIQQLDGQFDEALVSYQRAATLHRALRAPQREARALDGTGETYRRLGRAAEAVDFHRRAVAMLRDLGNRWLLAKALGNLTIALTETGNADDVEDHRRQAAAILADYTDPEAVSLREQILES
ncbi:tetratricopeptide (TPR) repeat protein [Kibdelosporangium banguiense]|uniref:Tetratricopeptide (TPR) repeat protein n=1 Tax=Kibdelosporangium banguiense TaxID=1365924 RepID=A0ABS4TL76_9PSEU|nr:tetratricopeptide repeat protein [Kibdelosporangium banguiense]MBP2325174.1 tetratricopeptide (TPR) repeat protein [Kibdelosporangium banguiense]